MALDTSIEDFRIIPKGPGGVRSSARTGREGSGIPEQRGRDANPLVRFIIGLHIDIHHEILTIFKLKLYNKLVMG